VFWNGYRLGEPNEIRHLAACFAASTCLCRSNRDRGGPDAPGTGVIAAATCSARRTQRADESLADAVDADVHHHRTGRIMSPRIISGRPTAAIKYPPSANVPQSLRGGYWRSSRSRWRFRARTVPSFLRQHQSHRFAVRFACVDHHDMLPEVAILLRCSTCNNSHAACRVETVAGPASATDVDREKRVDRPSCGFDRIRVPPASVESLVAPGPNGVAEAKLDQNRADRFSSIESVDSARATRPARSRRVNRSPAGWRCTAFSQARSLVPYVHLTAGSSAHQDGYEVSVVAWPWRQASDFLGDLLPDLRADSFAVASWLRANVLTSFV